jgi:hypothetical protein
LTRPDHGDNLHARSAAVSENRNKTGIRHRFPFKGKASFLHATVFYKQA